MTFLTVRIGPMSFRARLELERAPKTRSAFLARLPFEGRLVHARWSGEAGRVPLADHDLGVEYENATARLQWEGAQPIRFEGDGRKAR